MRKFLFCTIFILFFATNIYAEEVQTYSPEFTCESYTSEDTPYSLYHIKDSEVLLKPEDALIMIDGDIKNFKGIIVDGTTFVPIRAISENFDKKVDWNAETREVTIDNIKIKIGDTIVKNGSTETTLAYAPFIIEDTTFVPLRFIAESFGKEVGFVKKDKLKFDNSLVWIDDKENMTNDGKTTKEMSDWLNNEIDKYCQLIVNSEGKGMLTVTNYDDVKYVEQIGRYALFNYAYPVLVDMSKEQFYISEKGSNFSKLQLSTTYYNEKVSTETNDINLGDNLGKLKETVFTVQSIYSDFYYDDIMKIDYTYYDNQDKAKFYGTAYKWGYSTPYSILILKDIDDKEVLRTNQDDLLLYDKNSIDFADINFDGYVDVIIENGGTINVAHSVYLWNEESEQFEKANLDNIEMLSYYAIKDGYIENFIRGSSPDESVLQNLIWNGNTLQEMTEE